MTYPNRTEPAMHRYCINITSGQYAAIREAANVTGTPQSEVVRRMIDAALGRCALDELYPTCSGQFARGQTDVPR